MIISERIQEFIEASSFPSDDQFRDILVVGNRFTDQEGVNWDFKQEWPFSCSDDYFLSIARLIAAFSNTLGGLIVFGVHDAERTGGHNKVRINLDKLCNALSDYLTDPPDVSLKKYDLKEVGIVDCLLVSPRNEKIRPIRFSRETKYKDAIWVRDGNNVVKAETKHIPILYCRNRQEMREAASYIPGSVPPSPRTLSRFIGRFDALDYLFTWLSSSDDPIVYLYGKGGSGKTTIAHEFCLSVKRFGDKLKLIDNEPLDLVIFLSAKEKTFDTAARGETVDSDADFFDETTLYIKLLEYSGIYIEDDNLSGRNLDDLRGMLREFFDSFSCLVILDDIDTLTTKGVEVGTSFLLKTLSRSRRQSRVLCTQRNIPVHAISTSLEVPGLRPENEYPEFVSACVKQYSSREPNPSELEKLARVSERRPLLVEYIVALVRSCSTYEAAFRLFEGDTGNNIRDYVFRREWSGLGNGPESRALLAVLAYLNKPASFSDLSVILQIGEARLRDSIAETRAMFLHVSDSGPETLYSLDVLTREFVLQEAAHLAQAASIRARTLNFEKSYFPEIPQISRLSLRIDDLVRKAFKLHNAQYLNQAWDEVCAANLPASLLEHPQYKSLFGATASYVNPPKLDDARAAFRQVFGTKYEPTASQLRAWFDAEKASGIGFKNQIEICDFVVRGSRYDQGEKTTFMALKATSLYQYSRVNIADNPNECIKYLIEAVTLHVAVYMSNVNNSSAWVEKSEIMTSNTMRFLVDQAMIHVGPSGAIAIIGEILSIRRGYLDPLAVPVSECLGRVYVKGIKTPALHRARKEISKLLGVEYNEAVWIDRSSYIAAMDSVRRLDKSISSALGVK